MPKEEIQLPECPECDKLSKVSDESNSIGAFLDWLNEQGIHLASPHTHTEACYEYGTVVLKEGERRSRNLDDFLKPKYTDEKALVCRFHEDELVYNHEGFEKLLARYFNIDLNKVEQEKTALLEAVRKTHE